MPRCERLLRQWNLLKVLQYNRFGINSTEISQAVDCSKRQVQRDIRLLQQAGFPIAFDERDYGQRFWKLEPHFIERENLLLSVTEILSLILGRKLLAPLSGTYFGDGLDSALGKIKALLKPATLEYFSSLADTLYVKNVPFQDHSAHSKEISIINNAISSCCVLKITYNPADHEPFEGLFHPYGMVLFGAGLYSIGCLVRGDSSALRRLKISRFLEVELTSETFSKPADFSLEKYMSDSFGIFSTGETHTITVRLTGWAATSIREQHWHSSQKILEDTGDEVLVEYSLADTHEFRRWVMGFGRYATVIAPEQLAAEITAELVATLEGYE